MLKMVKGKMGGSGDSAKSCLICGPGYHCGSACAVVCGLVVAVAGILMIWPQGWFNFEHTFGLLVLIMGLKCIAMGFRR